MLRRSACSTGRYLSAGSDKVGACEYLVRVYADVTGRAQGLGCLFNELIDYICCHLTFDHASALTHIGGLHPATPPVVP